jgi:hypothetical protein
MVDPKNFKKDALRIKKANETLKSMGKSGNALRRAAQERIAQRAIPKPKVAPYQASLGSNTRIPFINASPYSIYQFPYSNPNAGVSQAHYWGHNPRTNIDIPTGHTNGLRPYLHSFDYSPIAPPSSKPNIKLKDVQPSFVDNGSNIMDDVLGNNTRHNFINTGKNIVTGEGVGKGLTKGDYIKQAFKSTGKRIGGAFNSTGKYVGGAVKSTGKHIGGAAKLTGKHLGGAAKLTGGAAKTLLPMLKTASKFAGTYGALISPAISAMQFYSFMNDP